MSLIVNPGPTRSDHRYGASGWKRLRRSSSLLTSSQTTSRAAPNCRCSGSSPFAHSWPHFRATNTTADMIKKWA